MRTSQPQNPQSAQQRIVSTTAQSSSIRNETQDIEGESRAALQWSNSETSVVIKGSSDYSLLHGVKNAILTLRQDFFVNQGPTISIFGEKRDDLDRRLLLLEHEIEGLLRRDILYNLKAADGTRTLDYTNLLNEKENQIVELEKKIENLEERLRKAGSVTGELENHITHLTAELRRKDDIIKVKTDALTAEVANKIQIKDLHFGSLLEGRNWSSGVSRSKVALIAFVREIETVISNPNATQDDIDRVLEGFLVGFEGSRLRSIVKSITEVNRTSTDLKALQSRFTTAAGVWKSTLDRVRRGEKVDFDTDITPLLLQSNIQVSVVGGVTQIERFTERTVEVPVQDARTKHLIHLLAVHMKKFVDKYPQLRSELDTRLFEFFQQEIIDVIEVDELDRVVEIVKYVPQIVKVENVYAYSSEKSRRVEFHLRVLVKALLEELEKLRLRTGAVLEIDEGIIGMINQEIMGVIDVDDILKVFRVVPKIVEVEKIIEKIVERVVEVPQVIPVEKVVEKIIEVPKIQEIERIVNVPIEVIKIVDNVIEKIVEVERFVEKVVEVPRIVERIVERLVEVPKVIEVERIVERIVPQTEVVTVEKIIDRVVPEIRTVEVVIEKIVTIERVVEKIIEVPTYIEKIVEKPVEVIKIVEVEKIVERLVKETDTRVVRETILEVVPEYREIDRVVEKIVVVERIVEKIVEVPQIVEKIVQVTNEVTQVREVEVIREKLVPVVQIREVEKIINQVVPLIKEVEKIVDRRVEVPIIQERIVRVPEIINQIVIERMDVPRIIEVERLVEKLVIETKIVEVEKPIIHYVKDPQVIKSIVERIIEVPRTVERIKEVRVNIDKLIEKMVEVPKVIEVEKIVEKIVVVPRVIEKIVEVPQIVEKIVERIIEVERIREVEKLVQVPVIVEKIIEVEVLKNVYIEVEKIVERVVEKIIPVERIVEKIVNITNDVERIVQVNNEIARVVEVERIVPKIVETEKVIEVEKPTTLTVEVPVEVEKIVEKVVSVDKILEKIVQVPQLIEKVVQVHTDNTEIREVDRIVEKIVVQQVIKEVPTQQIIVQEKFTEVPTIREKVVPIKETIREIVQVQQILEKIVERIIEVPKVVEVTKHIDKIIEVPKVVELEVIVPQLVRVNQIIEQLVEKIVQIPVINEVIKEVEVIKEKIVQVHTDNTQIKEVEVFRDKIVQVPQVVEINQTKNFIETTLQVVERFEEREVPIYSTVEKFLEVPHVLEKIVERIVILPQVVEVIKYIHEINESDSLVAVGVDVSVQEARYKEIYGGLRSQFDILITELRKLKTRQPELVGVITIIERYLTEFDRLASVQRIVRIDHDRIVEKEVPRPIVVPTRDSVSIANELSQSLLIEKLVLELKRITKENTNVKLGLDEDTLLIFFSELYGGQPLNITADLKTSLAEYTNTTLRRLTTLGGNWTNDHALMLNTILQERFTMANLIKNANLEIEKARSISDKRLEGLRRFKMISTTYNEKIRTLESALGQFTTQFGADRTYTSLVQTINGTLGEFRTLAGNDLSITVYEQEPVHYLGDIYGETEVSVRLQSLLRESQYTINALRDKLIEVGKAGSNIKFEDQSRTINFLRTELAKTSEEIARLRNNVPVVPTSIIPSSTATGEVRALQARNQELEAQLRSSKLTYENTIRDLKTQIERVESENRSLTVRLSEKNVGSSSTTFGSPQGNNINTPRGSSTYEQQQFTPSSSTSSQNAGFQSSTYSTGRTPTGTSAVTGSANLSSSGTYGRPTATGATGVTGVTGATGTGPTYGATGTYGSATYGSGLSGSRTSGTNVGTTGTTGTTNVSGSNYRATGQTTTSGVVGQSQGTNQTNQSGSRPAGSGNNFNFRQN